jgi:hypothetical protein
MMNITSNLAISLLIGGLVLVAVTPAGAWIVPNDFITGGGWYIVQQGHAYAPYAPGCANPGSRVNFGWHGGVKNGQYWGNGNYLDHGCGLHVHNTQVLDYVCISPLGITAPCASATTHQDTGTREICGTASTNFGISVYYRVRMNDTEPESAKQDKFGIILQRGDGLALYKTEGIPINGGNIELHKGNPSNTPPAPSNLCLTLRALDGGIDFLFP